MTYDEFDDLFDKSASIYDEYMKYITENSDGDRPICNGDDLVVAAENFYLYEDFRDYWLDLNYPLD